MDLHFFRLYFFDFQHWQSIQVVFYSDKIMIFLGITSVLSSALTLISLFFQFQNGNLSLDLPFLFTQYFGLRQVRSEFINFRSKI